MCRANKEKREKPIDRRIEQPNQEEIRTLGEKETYKYLGILEADTIKHAEMKENIFKSTSREREKLLETKLYSKNLIKGINTWADPVVRYSGSFLKWMREELQQMDQRTEKSWRCIRADIPEMT